MQSRHSRKKDSEESNEGGGGGLFHVFESYQ